MTLAGIRNIIFDFDGTLVDTASLIIATMKATVENLELPRKNDSDYLSTIGLRLDDIPGVLWPEISGLAKKYTAAYRSTFETLKHSVGVECFPGVTETLLALHSLGYRLAIASSRSHRSLAEYTQTFGLSGIFSSLIGGDDVANGKPSPEPVLKICDANGWNIPETIVVGDTTFDIIMGRNAETKTCGVSYGNQSREQLSEALPDVIIDRFPDILCVLNDGAH